MANPKWYSKAEMDLLLGGPVIHVDSVGTIDYTAQIQAALDTGRNVTIVGPAGATLGKARVTAPLRVRTEGQSLVTKHAAICPAYVGDAVWIEQSLITVSVQINGSLQPTTGAYLNASGVGLVAGIRVDPQQVQPMQCSVAGSVIRNLKGSAIIWDGGSKLDFTDVFISDVTGDGINGTATYQTDNNHGLFVNTHVIRAAHIGYWFQYGPTYTDAWNAGFLSGSHVLVNAKGFNCGVNFRFEGNASVGSVFSELGKAPDTFASTSRANDISVIQTNASFEGWVDSAPQGSNHLVGYANGDYLVNKTLRTRALQLGGGFLWVDASGRLRIKTSPPVSDTDGTVVGTQA